MQHRIAGAVAALFALAACQATPGPAGAGPLEHRCCLVLLKTGSRTNLTADEQREVFGGHFANMERLARAGELLLAGPFGQQRSDPALRGLFVLDAADLGTARALAETDPGYRAGVFALEYHPLATAAALRRFLELELAETDAAKAQGRTPKPGENGRGFVLLFADDYERARAALQGRPALLLLARLDETKAFAVLDAESLATAEQALAGVADLGPHRLEEWFASRNLQRLPRL